MSSINHEPDYQTLHDLPPLAGLCSMQRAVDADWSVERSVRYLLRLHYVVKRLMETLVSKVTAEPIYELKTAFSYHAYLMSEQVQLLRRRVAEMREPPLGLEKVPHPALKLLMDQVAAAPHSLYLLVGGHGTVLGEVLNLCRQIEQEAHPLADAPTVRVARLIAFELEPVAEFGRQATERLVAAAERQELDLGSAPWSSETLAEWQDYLSDLLTRAGGLGGDEQAAGEDLPQPFWDPAGAEYQPEPRRDRRFRDPYNAGVNPEAFLYDARFSPRDKTLMLYYKRLRELDVPEMMASILVELQSEEPWEFYHAMLRQLWDEARHAMMGEVGFAALGIDWSQIPINFTWSLNLNTQATARQRHGVLYFIEQGLMPRSGKRHEWEVATESGDPLAALLQDFDWADEVLHAHIGHKWYVPKFASPQEALQYGDECWSRILSHWHEYKQRGLTEHRNWWPDLYRLACRRWGVEPDPAALAFNESYENTRADLQKIQQR